MTDYTKLIESLRELADRECYPDSKMLTDAANALEKNYAELDNQSMQLAHDAVSEQPTSKKSLHDATGWAAPKDHYAVPVLFNPYTGEPRDVRDVQSDPQGILIVPLGKVEMLAYKGVSEQAQGKAIVGRPCKVGGPCVSGKASECACSELPAPVPKEQDK